MNQFELHDLMLTPIPDLPAVTPDIWKVLPINEASESLISLQEIGVLSDSVYAAESIASPYPDKGLKGSTLALFAREEAADRLLIVAQSQLPQRMGLVVMDAWRSFLVQQTLFNQYYEALVALHPDWEEDRLLDKTQKYVSLPSSDPTRPSPHNTGGSIDVLAYELPEGLERDELSKAEILQTASLIDTGVPFDHGEEEACVRYCEENDGPNMELFRQNRRLLYWVMKLAGFSAFPSEIWHYNYGNQMAAQAEGHDFAIYGAVDLSPANQAQETARRTEQTTRIRSNFPLAAIIKPAA